MLAYKSLEHARSIRGSVEQPGVRPKFCTNFLDLRPAPFLKRDVGFLSPVPSESCPRAAVGGWVRPVQPSAGVGDFCVGVRDEDAPPGDVGLVLAGRYELQRLIGFGATALVYEGVDTRTKRPIAVKVLIPAARARVGGFFGQEGRIAARVVNPHLVHASDFGEDQERLFIVFDLLPGRPLGDMIHGALLPCSSACVVALHVLDALAALNHAGIVHRDVKPDNIFVSDTVGDGLHATLLDVGFAAVIPPRRMTVAPEPIQAVFGTAGFIAPEVFGGHLPDPRSDLYSLGAVLYMALTGQPVPEFRMFPEIIVPSPQVFRPEIPDALAAVVLKALSDVESRFADANEMALAITRALREPVVALVPAPASGLTMAEATSTPAAPAAPPAERQDEVLAPFNKSARTPEPAAMPPGSAPTTARTGEAGEVAPASMATGPETGEAAASPTTSGSVEKAAVSTQAPRETVPSGATPEPASPPASTRARRGASWPVTWCVLGAGVILAGVVLAFLMQAAVPAAEAVDTAAGTTGRRAGEGDAAAQPVRAADPVPSPSSPAEAVAGVDAALRACAADAGSSFAIELRRDAGGERFSSIDILGDEATACARRVLEPLRFKPGDAWTFTAEYEP